jgi:UDP-N-acetylglucosamine 2-epimerase (non-hydrolysing)/GDP/UDP-N,N'-diacetylbacillosamine 2-epimerase (hydrolysing)
LKICVVTGSRAEYGLVAPVMQAIKAEPALELCLFVTGMHLSPEFGLTYREIEADGFRIDEKIEILQSADTPAAVAKAMGLGTILMSDAYERHRPDMVMLLGDRFELLAAAQAALVAKIPIAHISGGDATLGAFDEAIRHSITKMSHLHFVTNSVAARRVRQLGEDPDRIILAGNPGLDRLRDYRLLERDEFAKSIGFELKSRNLLVTFHPETLETSPATDLLRELLTALDRLGPDTGIIFTLPNADPEGRRLIDMIKAYVAGHANRTASTSLGHLRYMSAIRHVDAVVGNSSSGLLEVPSFKKPTVNIGERQRGRIEAASVITVAAEAKQIFDAIERALTLDCSAVENPYGDGHATERIIAALVATRDPKALLKKRFFDLPHCT